MIRRSNIKALVVLFLISVLQACSDPIQSKHHELCTFTPANQQFDAQATVEGKIAVVYKGSNYDPKTDNECDLDGYSGGRIDPFYFPDEMYARSPEDLDTLIMIELNKGDFLKATKYQMTVSVGWTVDVYSGRLAISLINYKTSTLVRNSVREFTNIPDKVQFDRLKLAKKEESTNSEYVVEPSVTDIRDALRDFSDKVKKD